MSEVLRGAGSSLCLRGTGLIALATSARPKICEILLTASKESLVVHFSSRRFSGEALLPIMEAAACQGVGISLVASEKWPSY